MSFKLVIFDCDGVMFDSKKANVAFYNQVKEKFGLPAMTEEEVEYAHMATTVEAVDYLMPEHLREAAQEYRKSLSYRPFLKLMDLEPDLFAILDYLKPAYKTAVCTNRSDTIKPLLAEFGLDIYFDTVVSCLDVKKPKPDPEAVFLILERLNVSADEAIYIGDSDTDEKAAAGAGVKLVAFKNPELKATYYIDDLISLKPILNGA